MGVLYKTGVPYSQYAINLVNGCLHGCTYCYSFKNAKRFKRVETPGQWTQPTFRFIDPVGDLRKELENKKKKGTLEEIDDVHLSFSTDPFPSTHIKNSLANRIKDLSLQVMEVLRDFGIHVTVLTKGILPKEDELRERDLLGKGTSWGITLISTDNFFQRKYEPGASGFYTRSRGLEKLHYSGEFTWVSIEPLPPPEVDNGSSLEEVLSQVKFVDRIILGRWNHQKFKHNWEDWYRGQAQLAHNWCKELGIELWIKDILGEKLTILHTPTKEEREDRSPAWKRGGRWL